MKSQGLDERNGPATPPRRGRSLRFILLAGLAFGAGLWALPPSQPAQADAASDRRVHRACRGDYKRLCPRYKVSSPQLRACMEAKSDEISSDCISALIESGAVDERNDRRR